MPLRSDRVSSGSHARASRLRWRLAWAAVGAVIMVGALKGSLGEPATTSDERGIKKVGDTLSTRRLALVIGNDAYLGAKPLKNAVADARAVANELEAAGFDVELQTDVDRRKFNRAVDRLAGRLSTDSVAVFYYAGHGVQIRGENYLLPTDLKPERAEDVVHDGVGLSDALGRFGSAKPGFTLAIVDACRDNPFDSRGRSLGIGRGLGPGSTPRGVMVVYSAGRGQVALDRLSDSDPIPNGLFTRELLPVLRQPGLTIREAMTQVKLAVVASAASVGVEQVPAVYDEATGDFYLRPPTLADPIPKTAVSPLNQGRDASDSPKPPPQKQRQDAAGALVVEGSLQIGSVRGKVVDPLGGMLPGVSLSLKKDGVSLSLSGTGTYYRPVVSNSRGEYHIPILGEGSHTLTARLAGFETFSRQFEVRTGQDLTIDVVLGLAAPPLIVR